MHGDLPRLGVDIGRVIIDGSSHPEGGDTAFLHGGIDSVLRTPAMKGAFPALARLAERFGGRVWLVSKCGERVEAHTRQWLAHHDFFGVTGIPADHLRFCRRRPDKAIHGAELGLTHFVDDHLDVLEAMDGVVAHRFLFGPQASTAPPAPGITPCPDWPAAEREINATLTHMT